MVLYNLLPHFNLIITLRWVPLPLIFIDEETGVQIGYMRSVMSYFNLNTHAMKKSMSQISYASND